MKGSDADQTKSLWLLVLCVGWLLSACQPSSAQLDLEGPSRPTHEQLHEATHAGHQTPAGGSQECLGRLVWDLGAQPMEWGVMAPGAWSGDKFRFSEHVHGGQDYVGAANISMVVSQPAKWEDIESMQESADARKGIAINHYEDRIKVKKGIVADLEEFIADPSKAPPRDDVSRYPAIIEEYKKEIREAQASIAGLKQDWHPIDLGLPQSLGYAAGPTLYAFLLRDGRAYNFMSVGGEGEAPFDERKKAFLDMLQRFKVRKLYEIPRERGLCIPYGFIPDDGTGHFRMEVSMRYQDRPGVIYTIGTAVVGERGIEQGESPMLQATARSAASLLAGGLTEGREVKSIGPRPVQIGALPAYQGGFSLNVAEPGQPPVFNYSVYTGYAGWDHSRVLPAITVNLRSFTKEQDPSIKENPPPIEESMQRLDALLKGMRLRPTDQPMPELAQSP